MKTSRDVFITIGRSSYTIQTAIENDDLDRIKGLIDDACGEITEGTKQEDMLMLACLKLAYSLDAVNGKLKNILTKFENE